MAAALSAEVGQCCLDGPEGAEQVRLELGEALRRSFECSPQPTAEEPQPFLNLMRLLNDAWMTRQWEKTQGWHSLLVPVASRRLSGDPDATDDLRARALVASAISCLDAATDSWTADGGTTPLSELLDQAMGVLVEPPA
ncbi:MULTISPECIES: hypothetical protein [Nocardia]|uniref:hypothetical protein n=1 Tax=Nocardia TaxID=1817 RepID=UPI00237E785C|nr:MULTISPECIES: hypothetical protein [Nocardia]MDE1675113.1 hypothetical protein [Nocardia gipuzkoensis]